MRLNGKVRLTSDKVLRAEFGFSDQKRKEISINYSLSLSLEFWFSWLSREQAATKFKSKLEILHALGSRRREHRTKQRRERVLGKKKKKHAKNDKR